MGTTFGGRPTVPLNLPYTFTINNGTITITGYTGSSGAETIPDKISGLPVTSIGYGAFLLQQPDQRHDPQQRHQHRGPVRSFAAPA